jgi:hypothetical protein
MKKTFLLATLLLTMVEVQAQDTVVSVLPKSNCFYNYWVDSGDHVLLSNLAQGSQGRLTAVRFETEDSLPVYGIAASLFFSHTTQLFDTSTKNCFEYLSLYKPIGGGLVRASDSLYVHPRTTPVAYYYKMDNIMGNLQPVPPRPVYEVYFDSAVTMTDSFYVGITQRTWKTAMVESGPDSGEIRYLIPMVMITGYSYGMSPVRIVHLYNRNDSLVCIYYDNDHPGVPQTIYPYIFPILTPPDLNPIDSTGTDTTHVDTTYIDTTHIDTTHVDTVGIAMRLLERYVGLQPNPATERVQVLSSFGLQRIEVYNATGVKVGERKAAGYSATLDVSALPAGPYLVRIATPRGTVTKKLVVRRR